MLRAILVFALVLGIVIGGLMLLRRTANMNPPVPKHKLPPPGKNNSEEDEDDSW
jgi:DUF2897 family protein